MHIIFAPVIHILNCLIDNFTPISMANRTDKNFQTKVSKRNLSHDLGNAAIMVNVPRKVQVFKRVKEPRTYLKQRFYQILEDKGVNLEKPAFQIVDTKVRKTDKISKVKDNLLRIKKEELINKFNNFIYFNELDKFNKKTNQLFFKRKAF